MLKRMTAIVFTCLVLSCAFAASPISDNALPVPNTNTYRGGLRKYRLNNLTVHTYESREAYGDWTIVFENETQLVILEPQTMPASAKELRRYLDSLGKPIAGILVSYHGVGPDSFPGVPIYASPAAVAFIKSGKAEEILKKYADTFPDVDPKLIIPTHILESKRLTVGGIAFSFNFKDDAFPMPGTDIAVPEHAMYYMHALGGDSHSILGGLDEIEPMTAYLRKLMEEGYTVFLTSHHSPESVSDMEAKIAYLQTVKDVASASSSREEFISEMKRLCPNLKGDHYLEMTAANLFK